jgi:hypothetical protein
MAYTYEVLSKMNVGDLRKIADGIQHDAVKGHSTMHKEKLIPALCTALGIEAHPHHHVVGTIDKSKIKQEIRALKAKRDAAIESHNSSELAAIRHSMHHLKRLLRKSIV